MNYIIKHRLLKLAASFSVIFLVSLLFALNTTDAKDLKIGYINFQRILDESTIGKEATKRLEDLEQEAKGHIELKKKEIEDLLSELRKKEFAITPEKKKEMEDQINLLKQGVKQYAAGKEDEIQDYIVKKRIKIINDIKDIVLKIGQDEKFDIILEREESGILFADPKYDITDKVVQTYDKQQQVN